MKKRNFLSHIFGLVERELEATLAILILLAGVVGYTLAGTEATTQLVPSQLHVQGTGSFTIGTGSYSTISFDSSISGAGIYRMRSIKLAPESGTSVTTTRGSGLGGAVADETYIVKASLSAPFTGSIYVWRGGEGDVTVNDYAVASSTSPVSITDATEFVLTFTGTSTIQAISVNPKSNNPVQEFGSIFVVPNTATMTVDETRDFVVLVTDKSGKSIPTPSIAWKLTSNPANIAKIDSATGTVTATSAGTLTVTASVDGISASATVTVLPKEQPVAVLPATDTTTKTTTTNSTNTKPTASNETTQNSWNSDWGLNKTDLPEQDFLMNSDSGKSLLQKIQEVVTGSPAEAATAEKATSASVATKTATAMFTPEVITARVEATKNPIPSKAEVREVTKNMTLTQKVVTNVSVGMKQIGFELQAMVKGVEIKDAKGNVILKQDSALTRIMNLITKNSKGANAGTMRAGQDEDLPQ